MNEKETYESWKSELQSAFLYDVLSQSKSLNAKQRKLFLDLAAAARDQSKTWEKLILAGRSEGGAAPLKFVPDRRARLVRRLILWWGPRATKPILAAMKLRGMSVLEKSPEPEGHGAPSLHVKESIHGISNRGGNNLRAAVFGANDGLLSNASLILGVAGASQASEVILLTGTAGLLAGAFSMAAGEYISVKSQRELFEYQIGLEKKELEEYPEEEAQELALIYQAKGIPAVEAKRMADAIISNPEKALDTLAREELGLDPNSLGSASGAALFSFVSFAVGAIVPLSPFFWLTGNSGLFFSVGLTAGALFSIGAALSLFTGRSAILGGLRILVIGILAGCATHTIGRIFGMLSGAN